MFKHTLTDHLNQQNLPTLTPPNIGRYRTMFTVNKKKGLERGAYGNKKRNN